jgi:hypothetical protein
MKSFLVSFCVLLLFFAGLPVHNTVPAHSSSFSLEPFRTTSTRSMNADAVVVPDSNPFFGMLGSAAACWYDRGTNTSGLLPLLVQSNGMLTDAQHRFLDTALPPMDHSLLVLGDHLNTSYSCEEILGVPPTVALTLASQMFIYASAVLILPYGTEDAYELGLRASPLASYLNIPLLFFSQNEAEIQAVCNQLQITHAYLVGELSINLPNVTVIPLQTLGEITDMTLSVIADDFGRIDYLTMTNPADIIPPSDIASTNITISDHITNKKLIIASKEIDLSGSDTRTVSIQVPGGFARVQISGEIFQNQIPMFERRSSIVPLLFMTLYDPLGHVVGYANSMGYDIGKTYLETLTDNASGNYTLQVKAYYGIKGGYFLQRGLSIVNADVVCSVILTTLSRPHLPSIPKLSMLAPYLTAAHGGLLLANSSWELTDNSYGAAAQGTGAGPWYTASLIPFVNTKVNETVLELNRTLQVLAIHDLLTGYLSGPAWLAILADTTMIPMYYYNQSDEDIPDRGSPSDNPYSLNQTLSTGRLMGWDVQDTSVLIARTLFYESLCGQPSNTTEWHDRFNFVFGQGFGETGGIFHQIPYAKEIQAYGFSTRVYGDLLDSRQMTSLLHVYTGANYIEYLGHGDWFWIPASWYGFDMYSKAVDVAHTKDWVYARPSVFLTSACLLGRTDGLPARMNIGLAMLHAGCNAFVGATRETGEESGLTVLENHLIVDDYSMGEALRGEKQVDTVPPTFYVRVLYGDPAFNPFEPQHGFSAQGRPILVSS